MIDINKEILKEWQKAGIDTYRIKSESDKEYDLNDLLLLDGQFYRFNFEIPAVDMQPIRNKAGEFSDFWCKLIEKSMYFKFDSIKLTFSAGLPKDRPDGFGAFSHAKCYIQFLVEIDEVKITKELEALTKPEPKIEVKKVSKKKTKKYTEEKTVKIDTIMEV